MKLELENQKILITGSQSGIGKGIAESFLKENASVILTGRKKKILSQTHSELKKKYPTSEVFQFLGDLNNNEKLDELLKFIKFSTKSIDHLICNIGNGVSENTFNPNLDEFKRMLEINLLNAVRMVDLIYPFLRESAKLEKSFPSVIFIGSICGVESIGCPVAYAASKSALVSYAKNISLILGRKGIRVNIVSPGNIYFEGSTWEKKKNDNPDFVKKLIKEKVPLQCFGDIEDVSNSVVFLASKKSKFVNGANWIVDGGQTQS